jgi:acetylornithine deacetylase/succinyl-diaminopimelate desuccinylase-like protein
VRVWLEAEEELGSPHLGSLLDRYGHLIQADGLAVSDSARPPGDERPGLVTGLRGLVDFRLRVIGPGRPLHSGQLGGEVTDPALVLARMVASRWDSRGRIAVPGFYRQVRTPGPGQRTRLAAGRPDPWSLARAASVPPAGLLGECGWEPGERSTLRPSLTVTGLSAGRTGTGAASAVTTSAIARINIRLVPDQRPADVIALVSRHLRTVVPPRASYRLELLAAAEPVLIPAGHPLVRAADRALRATWGQPPAYLRSGGTIPVVAELHRRFRMPAALWGLSRAGDRMHSSGESFARLVGWPSRGNTRRRRATPLPCLAGGVLLQGGGKCGPAAGGERQPGSAGVRGVADGDHAGCWPGDFDAVAVGPAVAAGAPGRAG